MILDSIEYSLKMKHIARDKYAIGYTRCKTLARVDFLLQAITIRHAILIEARVYVIFFFVGLLHILILTYHNANRHENLPEL